MTRRRREPPPPSASASAPAPPSAPAPVGGADSSATGASASRDLAVGGRPRRAMPGGAEMVREQRSAARQGVMAPRGDEWAGRGAAIITSAWVGTLVFVATTALAVIVPSARIPVVAVDLLLFVAGSGLYLWGWGVAAGRSREDEISLWNLILLEDVAPPAVRLRLLGAVAIQVVVAAATCWITAALAFGWLVPVWGVAHCEFWAARYGVFVPRPRDGMARRHRR